MRNWIFCAWFFFGLAQGAIAQGAIAQGAIAQGAIAQGAPAQDDQQPTVRADGVTVELIRNRVQAAQDAKELDDATRTAILDLYKQASAELELENKWKAQAAEFETRIVAIPERLEKTKRDLSAPADNATIAIPADATLAQLEKMLQQQETEVAESKKTLAELENEPKRRADRRVEIPKLAAAARERLVQIEKESAATPPTGESPLLTVARRTLLDARTISVQAEMTSIEKELAFYDASVDLLPLRRDAAKRRARVVEQQAKVWQAAVTERRQREVAQQSVRAELILDQVPDVLRPLAKENLSLAKRRKEIQGELKNTQGQLVNAKKRLEGLREQFTRVQDQEKAIGLNGALGMLLRKQRLALPDCRDLRRESKEHQQQIGDLQVKLLELQEQRSEMADIDEQVELALSHKFAADTAPRQTQELARQLVVARREYLDGLLVDHNTYFEAQINLDAATRELTGLVEQYTNYIDERVLWIRSANTLHVTDAPAAFEAGIWLLSLKRWDEVGKGLAADAAGNPLLALLALMVIIPLFVYRVKCRTIIREAGQQADCMSCATYLPTLRALACVVLISVLWPTAFVYLAWRLAALPDSIQLAQPLSASLVMAAAVFLPLEIWRQISRPLGLAQAHFGCSESSLRAIRRYLRWLIPASVPLVALVTMYHTQENERWESSLGRVLFIILLCLLAFFVQRVVSPRGSMLREVIATRQGGWLDRLKMIWYPLAVLTPLLLATLAFVGYFYTAGQLALRLHSTMFLILSILLGSGLLLRWFVINQRRIAAQQAKIRIREAAAAVAQLDKSAEGLTSEISATIPAQGDLVDLQKVDLQTRRLVRSFALLAGIFGTWLIWSDVIPALGMLERVPLWDTTVEITNTVSLADGTSRLESVLSLQTITLANLVASLLIVLMMFVAIKNIPGLLEVAILRHLPMDAALRFAFTTVTRYALIIVGMVWSLSTIGWGWAKIQWLIAAVSVGLGFGLQEIFANFVSGLILLFERPLRAGDVVTVGEVSGKVMQIRTRATIIQDWDRKELIIPNKEFITGRLLNWTLTDPVNRVVIPVGVAYGSDTTRTREIVLGAATDHPLVLADPAPSVTFDQFGESSLNFTLRAFLPNLDNRLAVIHDLHVTINDRLAEANIEIAFPQQDIHLRSMEVPLSMIQNDNPSVSVDSMPRKSA